MLKGEYSQNNFIIITPSKRSDFISMDYKIEKKVPNRSQAYQVVENKRQDKLQEVEKEGQLDEESLYYARLFMEE